MHQTRTASAKRPLRSGLGKLAAALAERLNRMVDALGPQPRLQPVPVRIRPRPSSARR